MARKMDWARVKERDRMVEAATVPFRSRDLTFPFGEYQGYHLSALPDAYIEQVLPTIYKPWLKAALQQERHRRRRLKGLA